MTLEHRHNRLPQIGVDRAETRDDIFRQRDRHGLGWPSELGGPAVPPVSRDALVRYSTAPRAVGLICIYPVIIHLYLLRNNCHYSIFYCVK